MELLTRRDFLWRVGLLVTAPGFVACNLQTQHEPISPITIIPPHIITSPPEDITLEDIALKEAVEEKYNILLQNPTQVFKPDGPALFRQSIQIPWYKYSINMLDELLPKLPEYFYLPDSKGEKVSLSLVSSLDSWERGNEVELNATRFIIKDLPQSLAHLTTKLVLRAIPISSQDSEHSSWYDTVTPILGGRYYSDISRGLAIGANNRLGIDKKHPILSAEQKSFLVDIYNAMEVEDSRFGLTAEVPRSLIAYMAGHYTRGEEYFTQRYGEILPNDKVQQLYEFVKTNVFQENHPNLLI